MMMKKILKAMCVGIKKSIKESMEIILPLFLWVFCTFISAAVLAGIKSLITRGCSLEHGENTAIAVCIAIISVFIGIGVSSFIMRVRDTIKISEEEGKTLEEAWKEASLDSCDEFSY